LSSAVARKACAYTIEFRHVAKTDDIKDFVIVEESSIAKGIRRIVAVTGHDAHDVSRQAMDFERRLTRIENMNGKEKEAAMKVFPIVIATKLMLISGSWAIWNIPDTETEAEREV
jgi:alanyl-tRNA synthetase